MAGDMIVRSSGGLAVNNGPSVLGEQQARIPVDGKIRPGIKVLTATGKGKKNAQEIYDAGVKAGKKWDTIERELKEKCGFEKSPLTPKNAPYFSVFRADFKNPHAADEILEKYGQDVDGVRRLMRFPVIFPTDSWQTNMPHGLNCYSAGGLQYWSDYDTAGNRRCMTRKPVAKNEQNKRAIRHFGGREAIPRESNGGVCDPNRCAEYQGGTCSMTGALLFFVPGVTGVGAISLPLKSFYGMEQARQQMAMAAFLRNGRISGTEGGQPIFYITKVLQEVVMLDRETGKPKRMPHWIVTLETSIDMTQLFQGAEQQRLAAGQTGAGAARALESPPAIAEADDHDDDDDEGAVLEGEVVQQPQAFDPRPARKMVADLLEELGIVPEVFKNWMVQQTQMPTWSKDPEGLADALRRLQEAKKTDPAAWKRERGLDSPF